MLDKSLKVLEFDKVVDMLGTFAASEAGKKRCQDLKPIKNIKRIKKLQEETDEAQNLIRDLGNPPLYGIYDLNSILGYAEKGGGLRTGSLLKISASLRVAEDLKQYLKDKDSDIETPIIDDMVDRLDPVSQLMKEIERIVISEGEIADNASAKLSSIRSSLDLKHTRIRDKVNSIVSSNSKYLQDNLATIRNGRHVVPVKSQYKSSFDGIVHDQSASGATIYIEPMAVVELNNEIKVLEEDEKKEIERILRHLSAKVKDNAIKIRANQNILIDLDFIFARAKLSINMDGIGPELNEDGKVKLINARHPLLKGKVVPVSLDLGYDFTSLLITGPNTGGKTVSLKTLGLFVLMAQAGLHIPADKGSNISIFENIFADIGDEQSIEQSLSTFSSHMVNIIDILDKVDENSLVLFDELGAGTDPTEGSALAISILDYLLKKNIRTVATTHYAELKIYALNTDGVENASVEFDVDSLRPTYKLRVGTVGKSNAFEISKRLGLQDHIISRAKDLISEDNKSFEDALANIEENRQTIARLKAEIQRKEEDLSKMQKRRLAALEKSKEKEEDIILAARQEANEIIEEARAKAKESIRELNKIRRDSESGSIQRAHEIKRDLDDSRQYVAGEEYDFLNIKSDEKVEDLKLGEEVEVLSMGQSGQVVKLPDSSGDLVVEIGILQINTNIDQIKRAKTKDREESKTSVQNIIKNRMSKNIKTEIDLRGKNIEEARQDLDFYLDDAYLAGLKEVRIIHGKGTGVLRKGVEDYLRTHKMVLEFRQGDFNEGGTGVTIASIKK